MQEVIAKNMEKKNYILLILWKKELERKDFQTCKSIYEKLSKINGIKDIQFTRDSEISNIVAFAEWSDSEIKDKISQIYRIEHVDVVDVRELVPTNAEPIGETIVA